MTAGNGITDANVGGWAPAILIAMAVLFFFLALAPQTSLWDRDEPRFARAAVEMARSGNWLYPTFNGAVRPDKPILIYWLMASSVRWMGATELAVRCWSALASALSCLFTFLIGRRLFSARAGLVAMLVLATSPLFMIEAAAATTDAVLLAAITAAMAAFVGLLDAPTPGRVVGLTAALALAQLTKGPVGLLVPLAAMAGALVLLCKEPQGGVSRRNWFLVGGAAAVSVLIFLLWAIPANAASGGILARVGLGHHVLERLLRPLESHGGPYLLALPYYLPVVAIGFMPWIIHVPGALFAVVSGGQGGSRARSVLLPWIVLPVVGFSLVATRLPHYVLPVWPALAIAVAGTLEAARRSALCATGRLWLRRGVWLYCPLTLLALAGGAASALRSPVDGFGAPIGLVTVGLACVAVLVIRRQLDGRPWASTGVLLGAIIATQTVFGFILAPIVDELKPVPRLAESVTARLGTLSAVATYSFGEPSLVFYLDVESVTALHTEDAVLEWADRAAPGVLILPRKTLEELTAVDGPVHLTEVAAARGFNISNGEWLELVALERHPE